MSRIALFQGSFDPFTRGHEDIVLRALTLFDQVVVLVVRNSLKHGFFAVPDRVRIIENAFSREPRVRVMASEGLTIDVARQVGACALVRGVRNAQDFDYEAAIGDVNRRFSGGIETVLLPTRPELSHVSSTIVREWLKYGKDLTDYLPKGLDEATRQWVLSHRG